MDRLGQYTALLTVSLYFNYSTLYKLSPIQLVYIRTLDQNYLDTARRLSDYFIKNLPSNGVVPWYLIIAAPPAFCMLTALRTGTSTPLPQPPQIQLLQPLPQLRSSYSQTMRPVMKPIKRIGIVVLTCVVHYCAYRLQ